MSASCGSAACSSAPVYGIGMSAPAQRSTGASRSSKACSWMMRGDLAGEAAELPVVLDDDRAVRLAHRREDAVRCRAGCSVRRLSTSALDALRRELSAPRGSLADAAGVADERDVGALAHDVGLAERDAVRLVRHLALRSRTAPCAR